MDATRSKYPRTPHLPFSRSVASDDITATEFEFLNPGKMAVVTEKMDGENTTLYSDGFHARSMDSLFHPSRSWIAGFHGGIAHLIPSHRRVVMENVYAEHSIRYDSLPTFAFGIGVIDLLDENGKPSLDGAPTFLSWEKTLEVFEELGVTPVPTLFVGEVTMESLRKIYEAQDHSKEEGIVVRSADAFLEAEFTRNVGKAVRVGHVTTGEHWTRSWAPNKMAKG